MEMEHLSSGYCGHGSRLRCFPELQPHLGRQKHDCITADRSGSRSAVHNPVCASPQKKLGPVQAILASGALGSIVYALLGAGV